MTGPRKWGPVFDLAPIAAEGDIVVSRGHQTYTENDSDKPLLEDDSVWTTWEDTYLNSLRELTDLLV